MSTGTLSNITHFYSHGLLNGRRHTFYNLHNQPGFSNANRPLHCLPTLGTAQPILISKISKSLSLNGFRNLCHQFRLTAKKLHGYRMLPQGSIFIKAMVFFIVEKMALALIISIQINPAPCSLHSVRNGISVTPAIGASTNGFPQFVHCQIFQLISLPRYPSVLMRLHCAFF